ncbi:MAG: hypothetical protein JST22_07900 [Bacteroidetes bacterium]|nr:hypothetical protein [Bacteroidota bacterium]
MRRIRLQQSVLAVVVLLSIGGSHLRAQSTYAARVTLAQALTAAKNSLAPSPGSVVNVGNATTGTISILDPGGSTIQINAGANADIVLTKGAGNFKMRVLLHDNSGNLLTIPPASHPLACDLEHSWLRRSWGLVIRDKVADYLIGSAPPGTGCLVDGQFTGQPYFMEQLTGIAGNNDQKSALANAGVSEWDLDTRYYTVPTIVDASTTADRNNLLEFENGTASGGLFRYIATYVDGQVVAGQPTRDTGIAKLAYTHVHFTPPSSLLPPAGEWHVTDVTLQAHTKAEKPSDCSSLAAPDGPDPNNAQIQLSFTRVRTSPPATETWECAWHAPAGDPDVENQSLWSHFDQSPVSWPAIDSWASFDVDADGYLYLKIGPSSECINPGSYRIMQVRSRHLDDQSCEITFPYDGQFIVDGMTGELKYQPTGTPASAALPVPCLPFATKLSGKNFASNVIDASASLLSDAWPIDQTEFKQNHVLDTWGSDNNDDNRYEDGTAQWRPRTGYAYRTAVHGGIGPTERTYTAGTFIADAGDPGNLRLFDWRNPAGNLGSHWVAAGTVQLYSPLGVPLEEQNAIGVRSATRFGDHQILQTLTAQNAEYASVGFESFETGFDDNTNLSVDTAHAGTRSLRLERNQAASVPIVTLHRTPQLMSEGVLVRYWAKRTYNDASTNSPALVQGPFTGSTASTLIAQTGEWALYEAHCTVDAAAVPTDGSPIAITMKQNIPNTDAVWVDDVRAQPYLAEMVCYVYDRETRRLAATLDDQHFGVFPQYDGKGIMVRTLRETERGVRTVAESEAHLPEVTWRNGTDIASATSGGGGAPLQAATQRADVPQGGGHADDGGGNGITSGPTRVNLFDLNAGTDGVSWEFLRGSSKVVDELKALAAIDTARLSAVEHAAFQKYGLGDAERVRQVVEVHALREQLDGLDEKARTESDTAARRALLEQRERVNAELRRIVEQELGVTEADARAMYDTLQQARAEQAP